MRDLFVEDVGAGLKDEQEDLDLVPDTDTFTFEIIEFTTFSKKLPGIT